MSTRSGVLSALIIHLESDSECCRRIEERLWNVQGYFPWITQNSVPFPVHVIGSTDISVSTRLLKLGCSLAYLLYLAVIQPSLFQS
jgi:hypothetical protein